MLGCLTLHCAVIINVQGLRDRLVPTSDHSLVRMIRSLLLSVKDEDIPSIPFLGTNQIGSVTSQACLERQNGSKAKPNKDSSQMSKSSHIADCFYEPKNNTNDSGRKDISGHNITFGGISSSSGCSGSATLNDFFVVKEEKHVEAGEKDTAIIHSIKSDKMEDITSTGGISDSAHNVNDACIEIGTDSPNDTGETSNLHNSDSDSSIESSSGVEYNLSQSSMSEDDSSTSSSSCTTSGDS